MALPVREPAIIEHLQQHVEHVRVRLFDLVEQHHLVGPPAYRLGQGAAFLVAHITGRGADQARDRMLLHVLRHVDADERALVVEQEFGQRLRELGLADAGRAEEHERADRPVRILQPGARPAHRGRHRLDRLRLADHALADLLLHAQKLFLLAFEHAVDGNAGPARDDLGDVVRRHRLLDHRPLALGSLHLLEALLDLRNAAVGELAGALVLAAPLRIGKLHAQLVELVLEFLGAGKLFLFRLPARRQVGGFLLQGGKLGFEHAQAGPRTGIALLLQRLLLDLEPDDLAIDRVRVPPASSSTCIFSRAAASSIRSIPLSGRKRSVM